MKKYEKYLIGAIILFILCIAVSIALATTPVVSNLIPYDDEQGVSVNIGRIYFNITDAEGDLMNWTSYARRSDGYWIGGYFGSNKANGTQSFLVENPLTDDADFYWILKVTDGDTWNNQTFNFSTKDAPGGGNPPVVESHNPYDGEDKVNLHIGKYEFNISDPEGDTMNWTCTVTQGFYGPIVGTYGRNNRANGTENITLDDPLTSNIIFYAWITCTDGVNWTNVTYTFYTLDVDMLPIISNLDPYHGETGVSRYLTYLYFDINSPDGSKMNWMLFTVPNIGAASGNNKDNGTYRLITSPMNWGQTYLWFIFVKNAEGWTNETFTFTVMDEPSGEDVFADFSYLYDGFIVNFTDHSLGNITWWNWYLGDGSTRTSRNVTHTYDINWSAINSTINVISISVNLEIENATYGNQSSVSKNLTFSRPGADYAGVYIELPMELIVALMAVIIVISLVYVFLNVTEGVFKR